MIVNLTQHAATAEQLLAGVLDLPPEQRDVLVALLTFNEMPDMAEIQARAADIALLATLAFEQHPVKGMIGGAPWMMRALEDALRPQGIEPVYAFSKRESMEEVQEDGSVRKTAVFRHAGFIVPARGARWLAFTEELEDD